MPAMQIEHRCPSGRCKHRGSPLRNDRTVRNIYRIGGRAVDGVVN